MVELHHKDSDLMKFNPWMDDWEGGSVGGGAYLEEVGHPNES